MPGSTHSPSSPQGRMSTLVNRGSLRSILDMDRFRTADLRTIEVVGAIGNGYRLVKNPGGNKTYWVRDQTGGRTYAPGAQVLAGSVTGMPGEAILGGPPGGMSGGSAAGGRSRSPGRRRVTPNQYAFALSLDESESVALLYTDGEFVSVRATTAGDLGKCVGCILSDSSEIVGDGSAILASGAVWDVENEVIHEYTPPGGGWDIVSHVVYFGGYLYWIETEAILEESPEGAPPFTGTASFGLRLRRSATDFSDHTTVQSITLTATAFGIPNTHFLSDGSNFSLLMVDGDGAVLYDRHRLFDPNHENIDYTDTQYRFALAGGAPATRSFGAGDEALLTSENVQRMATALTAGDFRILLANDDSPIGLRLCSKADDATTAADALWSDIVKAERATARALNVGLDGVTTQVYLTATIDAVPVYYLWRGTTSGAEVTDSVQSSPTAKVPLAMFYFGGD